MSSNVLLIGPRPELLRKARDVGLAPVALQMPHRFRPAHAELVEAALLVDFRTWSHVEPIVVAAHEVFDFVGVLSNLEPGLETQGRAIDRLGLGGNSYAVSHRLRDKWAMREHLAASGARGVAAALVKDRAGLAEFGRQHGYPVIVKPVDGSASLGVRRLDGPGEVSDAWNWIAALRGSTEHENAEFFPIDQFIVEQYIDGPEYSVEALSFDGRHVVIAVTEKHTLPGFVEVGHALPASLEPSIEGAVVDAVTGFLDVVGVQDGPTHTEVRICDGTPYVIESHTRTGGDRIVDLVTLAFDLDMEQYAVAWAGRVWPALTERPQPRAGAATRFIVASPGTVVEIQGVEEARAVDGVVNVALSVTEGDTVRPLRASWDRAGQVIACAADTATALARCEEAVSKISVVTEAPR